MIDQRVDFFPGNKQGLSSLQMFVLLFDFRPCVMDLLLPRFDPADFFGALFIIEQDKMPEFGFFRGEIQLAARELLVGPFAQLRIDFRSGQAF